MRKIKFRAWLTLDDYDVDGNDKEFFGMANQISVHHDGGIGFSLDDGHFIFGDEVFERALDNGNVHEYEEWCYWDSPFELMQFTGLKDKNGVEIYEYDLVVGQNHKGEKGEPRLVEWSNSGYHADNLPLWAINKVEVVGNKYENPELLEAKK